MDAMKYSMEADKYRSAYMPPSTLAMSMYSDPKYMDSSSKSYLERGYLDSTSALTKAYFESSKMYMDGKYNSDTSRPYPLDIGKMYSESQQVPGNLGSPRSADSPDVKANQERHDAASSSSSTTTSSAGASPSALLDTTPAAACSKAVPCHLDCCPWLSMLANIRHKLRPGNFEGHSL